MKFEDKFPSLKDNDYCSFNQIQKDKLFAVCLDKQRVEEVINKELVEKAIDECIIETREDKTINLFKHKDESKVLSVDLLKLKQKLGLE